MVYLILAYQMVYLRHISESESILSTILVPLTVPLTFVQGLKPSKRSNTHCKNKYKKKKIPRTPLLVPRIIELSKDVDPHLDQGLIVDPLTFE